MTKTRRRHWSRTRPAAIKNTGGYFCFYCGRTQGPQWCNPYDACDHEHHEPLVVDHVIPLDRGGPDADWNLVVACRACNGSKSNKLLAEWDGYGSFWTEVRDGT